MSREESIVVLLELGAINLTQDASSVFTFDDLLREARAYDPDFNLTADEALRTLETMTTHASDGDKWRMS